MSSIIRSSDDYLQVAALIEAGANVNYQNLFSETPLIYAIKRKDLETCKLLISNGADVNFINRNGELPLTIAFKTKNLEICSFLLRNTNIEDNIKKKIFFCAVEHGNFEIFKLIFDAVISNTIIDNTYTYSRIVLWASETGIFAGSGEHERLLICNWLIDKGAIVTHYMINKAIQTKNIKICYLLINSFPTPFEYESPELYPSHPLKIALRYKYFNICKLLIDKGISVNKGFPLIEAVNKDSIEMCTLLITHGALVNVIEDKYSPLILAAKLGNMKMCKFLVENGADPNFGIDKKPLQYAAMRGNLNICKFLIENGAVSNYIDDQGKTPLWYVVESCREPRKILNHANESDSQFIDVAKLLLENRADIQITDYYHRPLLYSAIINGDFEMVKFLLVNGVDYSFIITRKYVSQYIGDTLLHTACRYKQYEIAKL